jgi:hypothetical protein
MFCGRDIALSQLCKKLDYFTLGFMRQRLGRATERLVVDGEPQMHTVFTIFGRN